MPPTRANGDIDGLHGSLLSEDETRDVRMAELQAKRTEIQEP
jgi:hypothetical protein